GSPNGAGNAVSVPPNFGWTAEISCTEPCQEITPHITSITPSSMEDGEYFIPFGEEISFIGSGDFENGDSANAVFQWDFGDGNTATGETVTHTYPGDANQDSYTVTLTIIDQHGCVSTVAEVEVNKEISDASMCDNLQPFCSGEGLSFPNTTHPPGESGQAEPGPQYSPPGCWASQPNP